MSFAFVQRLALALLVGAIFGVALPAGSRPASSEPSGPEIQLALATKRDAKDIPQPRTARRNGAIFFDGHAGTMAINADATGLVKLRTDGLLSPGGQRVLTPQHVVVNLDGTGRRRCFELDYSIYDPDWSPDSKSFAYRHIDLNYHDVLYRVDLATCKKTKLTQGPDDGGPQWSPDGTRILFYRGKPASDLAVMTPDGADERMLFPNVSSAAWSPGGKRIAFIRDVGVADDALFVANADGTGAKQLTKLDGFAFGLSWAPDGRTIAFTGTVGNKPGLYVGNPNDTRLRRIVAGHPEIGRRAWSPDGKRIVLAMGDPSDVWVLNQDGSGLRRLTQGHRNGFDNSDPEWDPLGRRTGDLPGTAVSHAPGSGSVASPRQVRTRALVADLAADGRRVAYELAGQCDDVESWSPGGSISVFPASETYDCEIGGLAGVATAGTRVAWVAWDESNTLGMRVYVATAGHPAPTEVYSAFADVEIDYLAGDADTIAFTTGQTVLWRVIGQRSRKVARLPDIAGIDVAGGRIAAWTESGLSVLSTNGTRLLTKRIAAIETVALTSRWLVIQSRGKLRILDRRGGRVVRSWKLKGWRLVDADGHLAVLVRRGAILVIQLSSGRRTTLATKGDLADLEPSGLFYSAGVSRGPFMGRIIFVPVRDVLRRLR